MTLYKTLSKYTATMLLPALSGLALFSAIALASANPNPQTISINADRWPNLPSDFRAVLTCSLKDSTYVVSACLGPVVGRAATVQVVSGTYTSALQDPTAVSAFGSNAVSFRLRRQFRILARVPSIETGFVLHLTIKNEAGQTLYQDDTGAFDTIKVNSN